MFEGAKDAQYSTSGAGAIRGGQNAAMPYPDNRISPAKSIEKNVTHMVLDDLDGIIKRLSTLDARYGRVREQLFGGYPSGVQESTPEAPGMVGMVGVKLTAIRGLLCSLEDHANSLERLA